VLRLDKPPDLYDAAFDYAPSRDAAGNAINPCAVPAISIAGGRDLLYYPGGEPIPINIFVRSGNPPQVTAAPDVLVREGDGANRKLKMPKFPQGYTVFIDPERLTGLESVRITAITDGASESLDAALE